MGNENITRTLARSMEPVDRFASKLNEIEAASLAMQEILLAGFEPEHALFTIAALRKVLHASVTECIDVLTEGSVTVGASR